MCSSQDWRRSRLLAMGLGWERFDGSAAIHLFWFDTMFYSVVGLYSLIWFAIDPGWRKILFDTLWFGDKSKLRGGLLSGSHQLAAFADQLIFNSTLNARISNRLTYWVSHWDTVPVPVKPFVSDFFSVNLNNRMWAMIGLRMVGLFLFFIGIAFSASPSSQDKTQVFFVISTYMMYLRGGFSLPSIYFL